MSVVRRIFCMVGVEDRTTHAVKHTLAREAVPTPSGAKWWSKVYNCITLEQELTPETCPTKGLEERRS
jgi:hypothetical protein